MSRYTVVRGDTFEDVSRKTYGLPDSANIIARANPGAFEPLAPGTVLLIPEDPKLPPLDETGAAITDPDEVAITISGNRFRFWESATITRSIDSPDQITLRGPFEPDDPQHREILRPFSFKPVGVLIGGDRIFSGTAMSPIPKTSATSRTFTLSAYALAGVLNDCTPPVSSYPVEFNNQTLFDIAVTLAEPFGIGVVLEGDPGAVFERVAIRPGQFITGFIAELAKQRGYILATNSEGALLIHTAKEPGDPVADLSEGASPVSSVVPTFVDQSYYSSVSGVEASRTGSEGRQFTVQNSRYAAAIPRPYTYLVDDTAAGDMEAAVSSKIGRMFGDMVSYNVTLATWRDPDGKLWEPNTSLLLDAPGAMVYGKTELIIRSVTLKKSPTEKIAVLNLVLPGSFSGSVPESLPWEE